MSWSGSAQGITYDLLRSFRPEQFWWSPPWDAMHDEVKRQVRSVLEAADGIIMNGGFGDEEEVAENETFNISLSGHVNKSHAHMHAVENVHLVITRVAKPGTGVPDSATISSDELPADPEEIPKIEPVRQGIEAPASEEQQRMMEAAGGESPVNRP